MNTIDIVAIITLTINVIIAMLVIKHTNKKK
jgi:hypothetical protein